jgi:CheY-like chemotaxis protein
VTRITPALLRLLELSNMTAPQIDRAPTILIVEDNEDNRIVYSTMLRHFGFAVDEAENGAEGILKARTKLPDLILMDIAIPLVDGWEAVQRLKRDPATAGIPIVALTAHAMPADREKAIQVGCDGYLAKPCEPRAVVEEVKRILESKTA